jgi:hypothetical protein
VAPLDAAPAEQRVTAAPEAAPESEPVEEDEEEDKFEEASCGGAACLCVRACEWLIALLQLSPEALEKLSPGERSLYRYKLGSCSPAVCAHTGADSLTGCARGCREPPAQARREGATVRAACAALSLKSCAQKLAMEASSKQAAPPLGMCSGLLRWRRPRGANVRCAEEDDDMSALLLANKISAPVPAGMSGYAMSILAMQRLLGVRVLRSVRLLPRWLTGAGALQALKEEHKRVRQEVILLKGAVFEMDVMHDNVLQAVESGEQEKRSLRANLAQVQKFLKQI